MSSLLTPFILAGEKLLPKHCVLDRLSTSRTGELVLTQYRGWASVSSLPFRSDSLEFSQGNLAAEASKMKQWIFDLIAREGPLYGHGGYVLASAGGRNDARNNPVELHPYRVVLKIKAYVDMLV
jgi:hypothetical protein